MTTHYIEELFEEISRAKMIRKAKADLPIDGVLVGA